MVLAGALALMPVELPAAGCSLGAVGCRAAWTRGGCHPAWRGACQGRVLLFALAPCTFILLDGFVWVATEDSKAALRLHVEGVLKHTGEPVCYAVIPVRVMDDCV